MVVATVDVYLADGVDSRALRDRIAELPGVRDVADRVRGRTGE